MRLNDVTKSLQEMFCLGEVFRTFSRRGTKYIVVRESKYTQTLTQTDPEKGTNTNMPVPVMCLFLNLEICVHLNSSISASSDRGSKNEP